MKADLRTISRAYCAIVALLLIALGLHAWAADRNANLYFGALLCGTGLFMVAGLFGSITRVLAMLGLSGAVALLAFAFSLGLLVLHGEAPSAGTWTVWAIELLAGGVAGVLARELYRDVIG